MAKITETKLEAQLEDALNELRNGHKSLRRAYWILIALRIQEEAPNAIRFLDVFMDTLYVIEKELVSRIYGNQPSLFVEKEELPFGEFFGGFLRFLNEKFR